MNWGNNKIEKGYSEVIKVIDQKILMKYNFYKLWDYFIIEYIRTKMNLGFLVLITN